MDTVSVSDKKSDLFDKLVNQVNYYPWTLSVDLRNELQKFPLEARKDIVNRVREGCSPLFMACKKGYQKIAKYLINTCGADIEQKGPSEVLGDIHVVTPLWLAAVSGRSSIFKLLYHSGADINAVSDTGYISILSACFMRCIPHEYSAKICDFLVKSGANVNAKDIENKTALHYAIEMDRLETVKLLLEHGADYTAKSR